MDSIGGGGWGPIVASTLIANGRHPRYTIGSVNLAEFFVSFATIGDQLFQIIAGLVVGGIIVAPIAASLTCRIPVKKMMFIAGIIIVLVSIRLIVKSFLWVSVWKSV